MRTAMIHFLNFLIETGIFLEKTQVKLMGYMAGINDSMKGEE